jgi:hypothetical protein
MYGRYIKANERTISLSTPQAVWGVVYWLCKTADDADPSGRWSSARIAPTFNIWKFAWIGVGIYTPPSRMALPDSSSEDEEEDPSCEDVLYSSVTLTPTWDSEASAFVQVPPNQVHLICTAVAQSIPRLFSYDFYFYHSFQAPAPAHAIYNIDFVQFSDIVDLEKVKKNRRKQKYYSENDPTNTSDLRALWYFVYNRKEEELAPYLLDPFVFFHILLKNRKIIYPKNLKLIQERFDLSMLSIDLPTISEVDDYCNFVFAMPCSGKSTAASSNVNVLDCDFPSKDVFPNSIELLLKWIDKAYHDDNGILLLNRPNLIPHLLKRGYSRLEMCMFIPDISLEEMRERVTRRDPDSYFAKLYPEKYYEWREGWMNEALKYDIKIIQGSYLLDSTTNIFSYQISFNWSMYIPEYSQYTNEDAYEISFTTNKLSTINHFKYS